ncbi:DNA translocase FtsK [Snodgrassella alvi]|uniref:DNA translocase FtsK n=1 Tax=Snodgrassella alvi TaxID=1196083 RepID=UPI00351C67CE
MWWIVLILLISAIGALFWWRNIQERKWQLELTYLTRYENRFQEGQFPVLKIARPSLKSRISCLAQKLVQRNQTVQSSAQQEQPSEPDLLKTESEAIETVNNHEEIHPAVPANSTGESCLPKQQTEKSESEPVTPQITVIESAPIPVKSETDKTVSENGDSLQDTADTDNELPVIKENPWFPVKLFKSLKENAADGNDIYTEAVAEENILPNTEEEADIDNEESTDKNILITSEEHTQAAVVFPPDKNLEVITLAEATRKVENHSLADTVTEQAPALEVIQLKWQYKPLNSQNQQHNRNAKEITVDDPILNKVRSRTKAEQAALLKARALKNFDLDDLQQATHHKLGNSVGAPSHLPHSLTTIPEQSVHEHRLGREHNGVQIINEEDIRLNLLRQRLARQRHHENSQQFNSGYSIPVIAEDEIYANLAKTDSPVNRQKFQRPVVRESVIPAAARIGKSHTVKMTAPVADMSADKGFADAAGSTQAPLSTRFTPFHSMPPTSITTVAAGNAPVAEDYTSSNVDYGDSFNQQLVQQNENFTENLRPRRSQFHYSQDMPTVKQAVTVNNNSQNSYYENSDFSIGNTSYLSDDSDGDVAVAETPVLATEDPFFAEIEEQTEAPDYFPLHEHYNEEEANTDISAFLPKVETQPQSCSEIVNHVEVIEKDERQTESVPVVESTGVVTRNNRQSLPTEQKDYSAQSSQTAIGMALQKALHKTAVVTPAHKPQLKPMLPRMDLLLPPYYDPAAQQSEETLLENGITIEEKLAEFKVKVRVIDAFAGPVITRYEIEPAQGVRGSQVVNLEKDLARSLGFASIRVVETIPGKTCMGLELPNPKRQIIRLSEIFSASVFQQSRSKLTLALGQGITGQPVVTDLAKAPHLLVAGTTGSGKSVGVNAMILSMLYKATPEDVRLIMIDPKMLELSIYEGIPHLLAPVVTDMKLAANALTWCVNEMEKRYRLMSHAGVRNLAGFNQKIAELGARNQKLFNPFSLTPDNPEPLEKLPFIVVIVDEFADLMMTAGKKIEELIARLAQKARAAGIHLILATQRPSVDVITGLIKANIPTRIAFQVSSKVDSRTILDQMGAENLLGQGDMLFLPPGTAYPERVHGAFVADEEVHRVVHYLKQFGEPQYIDDILTAGVSDDDMFSNASSRSSDDEIDPLYDEAVALVIKTRKASISSVQRQLRIGYNRAARLVEQMEAEGIVSAAEGNGNRTVLAPQSNHLDG